MRPAVLFLTPGCFDKGGISRYSRYQIRALRDIFGHGGVSVFSVLGPQADSLEQPLDTRYYAGGLGFGHKVGFLTRAAAHAVAVRPAWILCAHLNLAAPGLAIARALGSSFALNVYGLEVWTDLRRPAAWALSRADLVVADCAFTARYTRDSGLRQRSVRVIWDCVDTNLFTPGLPSRAITRRYGIPDPSLHFNVLTLGRMSRYAAHKGYDRLLEAFAGLAAQIPQARLVYAGEGELAGHLAKRARQLRLADRVVFTGAIDERDMVHVYRSASIFSLISDRGKGRGEGLPLTPLEASACGVPILVGDQDGSQEAIQGGNGMSLPSLDVLAHTQALLELALDGAKRKRMAECAARVAVEVFGYHRFLAQHRELFERRGGAG